MREEGLFGLQSTIKGRKPGQILKAGELKQRLWRTLCIRWLPHAYSVTFLIQPRTSCPGVALPRGLGPPSMKAVSPQTCLQYNLMGVAGPIERFSSGVSRFLSG